RNRAWVHGRLIASSGPSTWLVWFATSTKGPRMLRTRRWTRACGVTAEFTTARNTTRWSTNRIPARQPERYFANSPVGSSHPSPRDRAERESKSFLERSLSSSAAFAVASWARVAASCARSAAVRAADGVASAGSAGAAPSAEAAPALSAGSCGVACEVKRSLLPVASVAEQGAEPGDQPSRGGAQHGRDQLPALRGDGDGLAAGDIAQAVLDEAIRVQPQRAGDRGAPDPGPGVELGAHPTRHQRGDLHAGAGELHAQGLGVVAHPRLDGGVVVLGDQCGDGADVDDPAAAARAHPAAGGPAQLEDGADHHLEAAVVLAEVLVEQRRLHREAGVVDEDVDGVVRRDEAVGDPLLVGAIGEVGGERLHLDAELGTQLRGDLGEALGVPCDQHESRPTARERSGEGGPDTCSAASDQGPMHGGYDTLAPP